VISQSFGATEQTFPSAASIQGLRSAYFNAARNHVTVLAATGDAGAIGADGRLVVHGRLGDLVISGGENVYPIEVEKTLAAHAAVTEAAVLGVDDDQYGQRLVAFVVLADGSAATTDELKAHVRENLANYKVPRAITVLDELPRGSTGKIVRRDLQALVEPSAGAP